MASSVKKVEKEQSEVQTPLTAISTDLPICVDHLPMNCVDKSYYTFFIL
jgi:hypothetical protein